MIKHTKVCVKSKKLCKVDQLFRQNRQLIPIKIKSTLTFNPEFAKGIAQFQKIASYTQKGYIIYGGNLTPELPHASVLRFTDVDNVFK